MALFVGAATRDLRSVPRASTENSRARATPCRYSHHNVLATTIELESTDTWHRIREGVMHELLPRARAAAGPATSHLWDAALRPCLVARHAERQKKIVDEVVAAGLVVTEIARDAASVAYWQQGGECNTESARTPCACLGYRHASSVSRDLT